MTKEDIDRLETISLRMEAAADKIDGASFLLKSAVEDLGEHLLKMSRCTDGLAESAGRMGMSGADMLEAAKLIDGNGLCQRARDISNAAEEIERSCRRIENLRG